MTTIPQGYKNSKVGIIPEDWETISLKDVGKVSMCKRIMKNQTSEEGEIPFYKISTFGKIADSFITKNLFENYRSKYNYPEKGEILISASGTIGKTVEFDGLPSYFQDSNIVWIQNSEDKVLNKFLKYYYSQVKWNTEDTTIKRLYNDNLQKIIIPKPLIIEQEKIAQILTTWDDAIEKQEALIQEKEQLKKGLMQKLLSGEVRFNGFDDEWKNITLEELFIIKKGQGLSKEKLSGHGKHSCILYGELYTTYSEVIHEVKSKTSVSEGTKSFEDDILIPSSTTTTAIDLAIASIVKDKDVLLGGDINILRKKKNNINGEFFAKYLTHIKKYEIAKYAQGITIIHLYAKDFKHLKVQVPTLIEQNKIAEVLSLTDNEIDLLKQELEEIKLQKKGLMQNLLTGKVRVKV